MSQAIDFYFDLSSPYGYLASERIDEIGLRHGREVCWRPYLMGAAYKINGMKPLLDIPLIAEYSRHDIFRSARRLGLPMQLPEDFPYGAVAGSRAYYWVADRDPRAAKRLAQALLRRYFADGVPVASAEQVVEVAAGCGIEGAALLQALQAPQVKERLRRETEAAIGRGVFGSPFFIVDGEPFFGNDRIEELDQWLARGGW